jgi:predicted O-methyltransferase YrrM
MSSRTLQLSDALHAYLVRTTVNEPPLLAELRAETEKMSSGGMQISPEQGRYMAWLIELIGAKRTLEVGVFTGYSSLSVALALPADGKIIACDVSDEWTNIARRYWERAGVSGKIELRLGPAVETLWSDFRPPVKTANSTLRSSMRTRKTTRVTMSCVCVCYVRAACSRSTTRSGAGA